MKEEKYAIFVSSLLFHSSLLLRCRKAELQLRQESCKSTNEGKSGQITAQI